MDLDRFKEDCIKINSEIMVQKYLLEGTSHYFDEVVDADEFEFKKEISFGLDVHLRDIAIIGSGKLGFSIKPDADEPGLFPFRKFDQGKKSDLDVAIVSNNLFDSQLIRLYDYTSKYVNKEIWKNKSDRNSLAKYILKGWLKPEFIPKGYQISDKIRDVQSTYKMEFGRDINIGIYKSWYYFENYHRGNVKNIQLNLIANG